MTPDEATTLIDLAYAQWPNLEPPPSLTVIWLAALGEHDFALAARATIRVCARRTWPPAVADIVAELDGSSDGATAWDQTAALVTRIGTSAAIRELATLDPRAGAALLAVSRAVREQPADRARAAFLRAYEAPDLERYAAFVEREAVAELVEFTEPVAPEECLADARRAIDEARRLATLDASWAEGTARK